MKTIAEIRRENLQLLIDKHAGGSVAEMNEKLGWPRPDPRLVRIRTGYVRADRGTPYQMGDSMAREIEAALRLDVGWMDNIHHAAPATVNSGISEDLPAYVEPSPSAAPPPNSATDYRTVAYSLAAALDSSEQKVSIRAFLQMVDAAHRHINLPKS